MNKDASAKVAHEHFAARPMFGRQLGAPWQASSAEKRELAASSDSSPHVPRAQGSDAPMSRALAYQFAMEVCSAWIQASWDELEPVAARVWACVPPCQVDPWHKARPNVRAQWYAMVGAALAEE